MFHWYGLFIGIAIVVGWSVAERIESRVNKVAPWVIGLGLVGARIYHVIDLWEYYGQNLAQVVAVWNGGMSIWGGLIGGGMGILITNHKFSNSQIERTNILGAIVTGLPLAQAIGRIGNGVNGEFVNKVWILPWWGAEAILDLMLFGIIWKSRASHVSPLHVKSRADDNPPLHVKSRADDNPPLRGMTRVLVYLVGYALIRLVLQPYRL